MVKRYKAYKKPDVDIVTATYGGLEFIKNLAQTLLKDFDAGVEFNWYIIDDNTPEEKGRKELIEFLRELKESDPRVKLTENRVNGGYAKSNNLGVSKGNSDLVLLLNSDTKIMNDGWLKPMVDVMKDQPAVMIVGAKLLFFEETDNAIKRPPGKVQHAGVAFNLLGHPYHIFMGWSPDHPKVNERRAMNAVTGACLMTRRRWWISMKGLDEVYTKGNFEDVEYCVRTVARGGIVVYEPATCIYHYGGGSDNTETIERNSKIFLLRNAPFLVWNDWQYF